MKKEKRRMRKRFVSIVIIIVCLLIPTTTISVNAASKTATVSMTKKKSTKKITVTVGDKITIKSKNGKTIIKPGKLSFKSSNKSIATISKKGVVKAKKAGKVKITITTKDKKKKAIINLTVKKKAKKPKKEEPRKEVTKYSIVYHLNGGSNNALNPNTYLSTTATITLKNPTRKGYTFEGWFTDASLKNKVLTIPSGSTGNKEFFAGWKETAYTIKYYLNGGENDPANPTTYSIGTDTIILKNPNKAGYVFLGWFKDSNFVNSVSSINKESTGDLSLYAKWEKKPGFDRLAEYLVESGQPYNDSFYLDFSGGAKDIRIIQYFPDEEGIIFTFADKNVGETIVKMGILKGSSETTPSINSSIKITSRITASGTCVLDANSFKRNNNDDYYTLANYSSTYTINEWQELFNDSTELAIATWEGILIEHGFSLSEFGFVCFE